jgi:hypothetical protein
MVIIRQEAAANLLQISRYLGHQSLETMQIYLPLTTTSEAGTVSVIEQNLTRLFETPTPV